MNLDEYYEVKDKPLPRQYSSDRLRLLKTQAKMKGFCDTEIIFTKKPKGGVEVKLKGHFHKESKEREKCDLGHWHYVVKETTWIYETALLSRQEKELIAHWLLDQDSE